MSEYGPQVTARQGTKRWFAQVAKRRTFLAVMESAHRADARHHAVREAEFRAEMARHQAKADAIAALILVLSEPEGNA